MAQSLSKMYIHIIFHKKYNSPIILNKTKKYIQNQEAHHQKMSFKEEYILFLKEYGIEYDEKYLWTD